MVSVIVASVNAPFFTFKCFKSESNLKKKSKNSIFERFDRSVAYIDPVPDTQYQIPSTRYPVPDTQYQIPSAWYLVLDT